jgi:hypothetical protein
VGSRGTFAALQVLDLLMTLAAFRVGAFEVNPGFFLRPRYSPVVA